MPANVAPLDRNRPSPITGQNRANLAAIIGRAEARLDAAALTPDHTDRKAA